MWPECSAIYARFAVAEVESGRHVQHFTLAQQNLGLRRTDPLCTRLYSIRPPIAELEVAPELGVSPAAAAEIAERAVAALREIEALCGGDPDCEEDVVRDGKGDGKEHGWS